MMELIMRVQVALFAKGYDVGTIDGKLGPKTRTQIKRYQRDHGLSPTGTMTTELLGSLGIQIQ
jgi:His-Xaa-Ser repeat protein HxsA